MKRLFSLLITLLLVFALGVTALADVLYLPDESFYSRHSNQCTPENQIYYTNGTEGYVHVYARPGGDEAAVVPNGVRFLIYYSYKDGKWGCLEYNSEEPANRESRENFVTGWVRMEDMAAEYGHADFYADHADELEDTPVEFDPEAGQTFFGYRYPGSGEVVDKMAADWVESPLVFSQIFTDSAGRRWGYLGYYMGQRNMWICLDDPYNPRLEADENCVLPKLIPAAEPAVLDEAAAELSRINPYLLAGGGTVIVIAAVLLAAVLKKRRRA